MASSCSGKGVKHWTSAEARAVLDSLNSSGLSLAAFCRRRGVNPVRLRRWKKRFDEEERGRPQLPAFLPVKVVSGQAPVSAAVQPIELVSTSGLVVRIPPGCPVEALRTVLAALGEVPPC